MFVLSGFDTEMSSLEGFRSDVATLRKLFDSNADCSGLLAAVKVQIIQLELVPPMDFADAAVVETLVLAREALEINAFHCLKVDDLEGFQRALLQLKPFYFDYVPGIPDSERKWEIMGLYLLSLLSSNRIAEFHLELERIPVDYHSNPFVQYAISMEQQLMEGRYNQLWNASTNSPSTYYKFFVDSLVDTVRSRILECAESAYASLSIADAAELLHFKTQEEALKFCTQKEWKLDGDLLTKKAYGDNLKIPAHEITSRLLSYATELERIV